MNSALNRLRVIVIQGTFIDSINNVFKFLYRSLTLVTAKLLYRRFKNCESIYSISKDQIPGLSDIDLMIILNDYEKTDPTQVSLIKNIRQQIPWLRSNFALYKLFDIMIIDKKFLDDWLYTRPKTSAMLTNSNLLLGKSYIPPQKIISEDMMYLCDLVNAFYFYVRDWEILAHKDANYSAWRCYAKIRKLLGLPGLKVPRSSALPGNLHLEAFNELASISKRYSMEYNLDDYKKNADINGRSIKVVPDESLYLRPEIDPKTVIMTQSMFNMYAIFCRPTLAARYFNNRILNTTCDKLLAIHLLMRNKKLLDKTKTNFFQPEEDGVTKLEYEFNKNKEFLFNILELDIRPEVREQVKGVVKKLSQSEVSICTKIHVLAAQFLILHHCIMEDSSSQLRSDFLRVFQNT